MGEWSVRRRVWTMWGNPWVDWCSGGGCDDRMRGRSWRVFMRGR